MILVTTIGKVGAQTARLLAERRVGVRVLARDPEKASELDAAGVEVVLGDLDDPATVNAAMERVDTVVLVTPAVVEQELGVIDSVVRAEVSHVVKITSLASADSPIARQRGQARIEAALRSSGLAWTLLRNNFYMQNLLMLAPAIAGGDAFGSSAAHGKIGLIDTRDVAAVAAEIAITPHAHTNTTYRLTGPQLLSYPEMAEVLTGVLGRRISFTATTREQDTQTMVNAGVPESIAAMNAHAVSLIADGDAAWLSDDVARILGRAPLSFDQFASDHAAAFRATS